MCPRIKDNPCQLLRLRPSCMKGNHKLKPVCFQKYNLCLVNMKFKGTAEYTSPTPKKNTLENRRFNSNALCGAMAAPLRCMHLPDFKHIKLGLREPLACWTWLKYPKDRDPFTYRPVEEAGEGKAVGGSPALYSGKEEGISRGFTGIKASLCGYNWLGLCDKGSWWSVGSAKHWILSRAL